MTGTLTSPPRPTSLAVDADAVRGLAGSLRGRVFTADTPGYGEARTIWNAMIDKRPAVIARCAGAADVQSAVRFAREHGLDIAVRGGGHNIAGSALVEGGLVIDLSSMKSVRVDPARRTAVVEPGVTLGEFDHDAQAFGLATPVGINSTTGIAGLTLGGGFGWLSRTYGMTVDNLHSADVVTASGEFVRASERENADLFWWLRGGGGNFGIVTAFEFGLHPVGPQVTAGLIVHPAADANTLLRRYREVALSAPNELSVWVVMRKAPPLPFLPAQVHGTDVVVFAVLYSGDMQAGERAVAPLRAIGKPIADVVSPHPYAGFQAAFDPLLAPGARNYWKTHDFAPLGDDALDLAIDAARRLPGPQCEVFLAQMGGAVRDTAEDATAYSGRNADFIANVHARWTDPADDERYIGWARRLFTDLTPHATGNAYVNFMTQDEGDRVQTAYGSHYGRLATLKKKYDPSNVLRTNQNIAPAA
ncbi:MAG: FAD-binding oxidoreductase [Gemmatimonadaceae bacterium]